MPPASAAEIPMVHSKKQTHQSQAAISAPEDALSTSVMSDSDVGDLADDIMALNKRYMSVFINHTHKLAGGSQYFVVDLISMKK